MIPVNRPYVPDISKYTRYVSRANEAGWLTNFGPLQQELTAKLEDYLGVRNLLLLANGTLALQLAYEALGVKGQAATTPFSFVATTSSLAWQGIRPLFADIDRGSLNLSAAALRELWAQERYSAIVATHVYGNPCDVQALKAVAAEQQVPLIYDAAHAFAVRYQGESVLHHGDASILSLHATKLYHCIEGGAIVFADRAAHDRARAMANFGMNEKGEMLFPGINAKLSEYHAAAGLVVLESIDEIIERRQALKARYVAGLAEMLELPRWLEGATDTGAYMPVILPSAAVRERVQAELAAQGIQTRRYFAPSLAEVPCYQGAGLSCPVSADISGRVICLPLYFDLSLRDVDSVVSALRQSLA